MERSEDQIAQAGVKKFLATKRKDRAALERLRHSKERSKAAQQIATKLGSTDQETIDRIDYYLSEQLRRELLGPKAKRHEAKAVKSFLKSDIELAIGAAVDRGLELLSAEPKEMERLIEDVAVEIQRLILMAKKEFSFGDELHHLEESYSLPAVESILRNKLCLVPLARFHQEVSRTIQLHVAKFEQAGRPDEKKELIARELVETLREVAGRALERLTGDGVEGRVLTALESHVEEWIAERCTPEALEALFSIE